MFTKLSCRQAKKPGGQAHAAGRVGWAVEQWASHPCQVEKLALGPPAARHYGEQAGEDEVA